MKISLIIPTYNRQEVLRRTLEYALAQVWDDYEVIVVDQTPSLSAELRKFLNSASERIRYFRMTAPNLPAARNVGVRAAHGEIVVFVDDDVVFEPDYIALHARRFSDPGIGAVMALTIPAENGSVERATVEVCAALGISGRLRDGVSTVDWVNGCSSYRRRALLEVGMSDERFGGSGWSEDADLAVRVRQAGYRLLFDSTIRLVHLALPSGGCQNRSPETTDRIEQEHVKFFAFFNFKNRRFLGLAEVSKNLWRSYRLYVINRRVLRAGMRAVLLRQVRYSRAIVQALRTCAREQPSPDARNSYELPLQEIQASVR